MKIIAAVLMLGFISTANAWDNPDIEKRYERKEGYESSFGRKYEYDLSKPVDKIRYQTDERAKLRDSLDVDPRREIERDLGQQGGGIFD